MKTSIKIRLKQHEKIAMGPGKADLLAAIGEQGSISAAGRVMGMSYKRAWDLVKTMNESFNEPLVSTAKGGPHGGGAEMTPLGHRILAHYHKAQQLADAAAEQELKAIAEYLSR